jgi:dephospho-CoA kinase
MHRSFGLTGGIASGKSTVARFLGALGAKVIDADGVGHELLQPSNPVYNKVVSHFGQGILKPGGEIERERLGSIVFADPRKLSELTSIVHPSLIARVEELAQELRSRDPRAVIVVDAALIYEAGVADRFAKILVAWCRPEQQIERLTAKSGLSRQDALRRLASQMPAEEKRRRADYVIDCSGSLEQTRAQVEALYPEIKRLAELETRNSKFEIRKSKFENRKSKFEIRNSKFENGK